MVETPGETKASTLSNTWRTICPLRRIFSISPEDLQTIAILDCLQRLRGHVVGRQITSHFQQSPTAAIIVRQGKCLLFVSLQALNDHFFTIVTPRAQNGAIYITDAGDARWLKVNVIDSPTGGTGT